MTATITAQTVDNPQGEQVDATIYGPLAVHRTITRDTWMPVDGYAITQIASGRRIRGFTGLKIARQVAAYIASNNPSAGWFMEAPTGDVLKAMRDDFERALDIVERARVNQYA